MPRIRPILSSTALAALLLSLAAQSPAADPPTTSGGLIDSAAKRLLADRLLNDARSAARSTIPSTLTATQALAARQAFARQALDLLLAAREISPDSLEILHALAEAARETRDPATLRDALRQIVRLDPTDLVTQVNLLSAAAESAQTVEDQSRVYDAALAKESLDPQVRSELALRYARLFLQRGENDNARKLLDTAVKLNDVNANAWEEIVRLQAAGPTRVSDRISAISSCLLADPYRPAVWIAGGRALAATNQHDLAAQFLGTAIDGLARTGGGSELFLEWATELAISGNPRADNYLTSLAKLDDASINAMVTSFAVSGAALSATSADADPLVMKIRARLAEYVAAAPANKQVLAEASWIEIVYMPTIAPAASDYLDRYAKIAGENDDSVKVRRGWLLIRQSKLADAAATLTPLAASDPFAQLGLARISAAQNDLKTFTAQLQDIYNGHPTGMLALQVASLARKEKIKLKETALGNSVAASVKPLLAVQAAPKDLMLITPSLAKRKYAYAEPIVLNLKIANTSDRPLSVGPAAAIKSVIGLGGSFREPVRQSIGLYATDNSPRVFRLAPRASYSQNIRVDQDIAYEIIMADAWKSYAMDISLITDPLLTPNGVFPGNGGQLIIAGEFLREAAPRPSLEDVVKRADSLPQLPLEGQMLWGLMLVQLLPELTDEKLAAVHAQDTGKLAREHIAAAVAKSVDSSPLVKAWFLRNAPPTLPKILADSLAAAADSHDTAARLQGLLRLYTLTDHTDPAARAALHDKLAEFAAAEKDPIVKDFAQSLAQTAAIAPEPPAPPATTTAAQPATAPTPPASLPATAPATTP